MINNLKINL